MGRARRRKKAAKTENKQKNKHMAAILKKNFWPLTLSVASLIVTTIGGNVLNDISSFWGYIVFVFCLCLILGYWAWRLSSRVRIIIRVNVVLVTVLIIIFTSQWYIGLFLKDNGSIEMPTFIDDSTQIVVLYGNRTNPGIRTQTTIGELRNNPETVLYIGVGNNCQNIFYVHIDDNKLLIDTQLFAGLQSKNVVNPNAGPIPAKYPFNPPVTIKNNAYSKTPEGWKINQNKMNLEIVNDDGLPVLVMEYKSPYKIIISGLFPTPMGICKVNNNETDAIYAIGDTLSELGTYKVDKVFNHSIFDLFKSERVYDLAEYE